MNLMRPIYRFGVLWGLTGIQLSSASFSPHDDRCLRVLAIDSHHVTGFKGGKYVVDQGRWYVQLKRGLSQLSGMVCKTVLKKDQREVSSG